MRSCRKSRGSPVMQQSQGPDWFCGSVEDQLRPLRAARIFEGDPVHACPRDQARQFFDLRHRCVRWFERPNPGVAFDIEADVAWANRVSGGEGRAADHVLDVLGDDLLVADSVLHRADGACAVECVRYLCNRAARMDSLSGYNAVIAAGQFLRVARSIELCRELSCSRKTKAVLADGVDVIFPDVIGPDFSLAFMGEVRGKQAADRATTDNADL